MYKSIIAIFFSVLFGALITAPTISIAIDADYDVSILLDATEEEEKEGKESLKDIEIKVLHMSNKEAIDFASLSSSNMVFYLNKYSSNHLELFSPPPEHNI